MNEEIEVDREALIELHRMQNLAALTEIVASGELTQAQAVKVHEAFMKSEALQSLVAIDVATAEAMLAGVVH